MIMRPQGGAPKCPPSAQLWISARVVSGRAAKIIYIKLTPTYTKVIMPIYSLCRPLEGSKSFSVR